MPDYSNLALVGLDSNKELFQRAMELCRTLQSGLEEEKKKCELLQRLTEGQEKLIAEMQSNREKVAQDIQNYLVHAVTHWRQKVSEAVPDSEDHLVARCYVDAFQSVHTSLFGGLVP